MLYFLKFIFCVFLLILRNLPRLHYCDFLGFHLIFLLYHAQKLKLIFKNSIVRKFCATSTATGHLCFSFSFLYLIVLYKNEPFLLSFPSAKNHDCMKVSKPHMDWYILFQISTKTHHHKSTRDSSYQSKTRAISPAH